MEINRDSAPESSTIKYCELCG